MRQGYTSLDCKQQEGEMDEATRTIIATKVEQVGGGETNGRAWTIYGVTATDAQGQPIRTELRAFDRLPIGVPIECAVERRDHPEYGTSFTLKPTGPIPDAFSALEARVAALEGNRNGAPVAVQVPAATSSGGSWDDAASPNDIGNKLPF